MGKKVKKQTVEDAKRIMYRAGVALRKLLWEPETMRVCGEVEDGELVLDSLTTTFSLMPPNFQEFRIVREKDWQRVIRLARKAKERGDE